MLRFFSKRVGRNAQKYKNVNENNARPATGKPNKNVLPCTVTLLDHTELHFELPVSFFFLYTLTPLKVSFSDSLFVRPIKYVWVNI